MHNLDELYRAALAPLAHPLGEPGLAGSIKSVAEDFEVEEIPAYMPCGDGEHLFIFLQKRNLSSFDLVRVVAQALGCKDDEVSLAGMKDAVALTRQWICVPARLQAALAAAPFAGHPNVTVLQWGRHTNKLKTGHLKGNRFVVRIRDVCTTSADEGADVGQRVAAIVNYLQRDGFANAYGSQRFGRNGETILLGLRVLGIGNAPRAPRLGKRALRLALSAVQAALFNAFVQERDARGALRTLEEGDIALVRASSGPFVVDDATSANARVAAGDIVLGGPLYGPKMRAAQKDAHAREETLLTRFGMGLDVFGRFSSLTAGGRRPVVCWPTELTHEWVDGDVVLRFTLPSGCYATQLLSLFGAMPPSRPTGPPQQIASKLLREPA